MPTHRTDGRTDGRTGVTVAKKPEQDGPCAALCLVIGLESESGRLAGHSSKHGTASADEDS